MNWVKFGSSLKKQFYIDRRSLSRSEWCREICPTQEHITLLMALARRLLREFKKIKDDGRLDYTVQMAPKGINNGHATLFGAKDTDWADAVPDLEFAFSSHDPDVASDAHFVGTIPFHPNVYANGKIGLDLLEHNWSSAYGVDATITSIQTLPIAPNPNSPANNTGAVLYTESYLEYRRRVRCCVESSVMNQPSDQFAPRLSESLPP
jgi:ubiquitin-protein ligase